MKRFVAILNSRLRQKVSMGLLILSMLGVVGGGSVVYLASRSAQSVALHSGVSHTAAFHTEPYHFPEPRLPIQNALLGRAVQASVQQTAAQHVAVPQSPLSATAAGNAAVAGTINQVFGLNASAATGVAICESGLNPSAYNGSSGASGVFQIMPGTWGTTPYAGYSPFDAWANISAAHAIFMRDGYSWREWSCKP